MGKIVFFGSGPVAAKSLELLAADFEIEAVITKPKPAHHKGEFPVITVADRLNLPLLLVHNKKELSQLMSTQPVKSELGILIDFGIIITQDVIGYFPLGIINSHFSVLPEWRGADPINFAILSGQKTTGVSLMRLVEKMDEGPLLAYGVYELPPDITSPELTKHLVEFSYRLLKKSLPGYNKNSKLAPQSITQRKTSYSRKLTKSDGVIDWTKPAKQIEREIRAFLDWPKSRTTLLGKDTVIIQAKVSDHQGEPGEVIIIKNQLIVVCSEQSLTITKLKPAGKNIMTTEAFLAGYKNS